MCIKMESLSVSSRDAKEAAESSQIMSAMSMGMSASRAGR